MIKFYVVGFNMIPVMVIMVLYPPQLGSADATENFITAHSKYYRNSHRLSASQLQHQMQHNIFDAVHVKMPDLPKENDDWKLVLNHMKKSFNRIKLNDEKSTHPPVLLNVDRDSNFEYVATWCWKPSSSLKSSNYRDQTAQQFLGYNESSLTFVTTGVYEENPTYFSLYIIHHNIFSQMSTFVNSKFVFDVLPQNSNIYHRHSLVVSNLKPFAKYEIFVTATSHLGESAKSNSITISNTPENDLKATTAKEVLLIVLSLIGWALLVCMFYRQWGAIKNLQPRETRFISPDIQNLQEVEKNLQQQGNPPIVVDNGTPTEEVCKLELMTESRVSKIEKFKKMRDYRVKRLKNSSLFSLSQNKSRSNLSIEVRNDSPYNEV